MPDSEEELCWWWSCGERICPAGDIEHARRIIAYVVTPTAEPADGR
ncbi:hypothetical protein NE236_16815 [Actinoallomurus purpureus]|nr:hypothetical protein [Actinoallomurus purpureus]MCO6006649.1 hypothetical protein [Actinoallomurus purpureus]